MENRQIAWTGSPVLRGSLPKVLEAQYHEYAFDDIERKPGYYYDSVGEWADLTSRIANRAREQVKTLRDGALAIQEWELLEKMMVCWRVKGMGSLVLEHPIVNEDVGQARWLEPELRRLGRAIAAAAEDAPLQEIREVYLSTPVPIAKGKGSPYWFSATDRKVVVPLARIALDGKDLEEVEANLRSAGHATMPLSLVSYIRIQAARKPREAFSVQGGQLVGVGEAMLPKVRRVQAMPFSLNLLLFGIAGVMKHYYRKVRPSVNGKIDSAVKMCAEMRVCVATDLSAMDESVAYETIDMWNRFIHEPLLDVLVRKGVITTVHKRKAMDVVERAQTMMILAPPPKVDEAARLVETKGTNKSGIVYTSLIATMVNETRCRAKANSLNLKVGVVNFGDDTVIGSDDPKLVEKWTEPKFNNHGFTETIAPDVSFLMRRIPQGYNYYGRMLMSTINREPRFEPKSVFAAAAGIGVRHALLQGHPLQHEFIPTLTSGSTRLADVCAMAVIPIDELLEMHVRTAVKRAVSSSEVDEVTSTIDGAAQSGVISRTAAEKLRGALEPYTEKAYQSWGAIMADARLMAPRVANKVILRASYTIRT